MKTKLLLMMLMVVGLMAGAAQAASILPNAGFEVGTGTLPEGWTGQSYNGGNVATDILWIDDPCDAYSGDKYMKLLTNSGSEPYIWPVNMVPVTAGGEYNFSVWAKSTKGDATPPTRTEAFILFYAADQSTYFWEDSPRWQLSPADVQWPTTWTKWDIGTFTAPAEAAYVDFNLVSWEGHESGTGLCYDDASMVDINALRPVRDPDPDIGETVAAGDVVLGWTNADPDNPGDPVYVDVWFGTDPNEMAMQVTDPASGENVTTVTVNAPDTGTYYWRVDSYIYGPDHINEPNTIEGPLWYFYTSEADFPPSVVIDTPDMITWSGQKVSLNATVTDDGKSALTILWTADPAAGVVFSDPDASVADPNVTITKAAPTGDATTVTLTIAVSDEGNPTPVEDTMTIDVYDDACKAAIGAGATYNETDLDQNCITDLKDLAALLAEWLKDTGLTAATPK